MDPIAGPVITKQQTDKAHQDRVDAALHAGGLVAFSTLANRRLNAPGGPIVQVPLRNVVTGLHATPQPSGRAKITLTKGGGVLAFLPAPVGYVPPEFFNLHPEFWKQSVGRPPFGKTFGFDASKERIAVFKARQDANAIGARLLGIPSGDESLFRATGMKLPPGPVRIFPGELAFLQSLPAGTSPAQFLIPQLEDRLKAQGQFAPHIDTTTLDEFGGSGDQGPRPVLPIIGTDAEGDPIFGDAPMGSTQPELVQPVNGKAIAIQASATGIRKQLVTERADP